MSKPQWAHITTRKRIPCRSCLETTHAAWPTRIPIQAAKLRRRHKGESLDYCVDHAEKIQRADALRDPDSPAWKRSNTWQEPTK